MKKIILLTLLGAISFAKGEVAQNDAVVENLDTIVNEELDQAITELGEGGEGESGEGEGEVGEGEATITSQNDGTLTVANTIPGLDGKVKTLPGDKAETAINAAEKTINPNAIKEAIANYDKIVAANVAETEKSLKISQDILDQEKAADPIDQILIDAAQQVVDAKKELLDMVIKSELSSDLIDESNDIKSQDEKKLIVDKIKYAAAATTEVYKEDKWVLKIDTRLLAYQRLKGVDAATLRATEERVAKAQRSSDKAAKLRAEAANKLAMLKSKNKFNFSLIIVFVCILIFVAIAGWFVFCKKEKFEDDPAFTGKAAEGGEYDDRYVRFIDNELST